MVVLRACNGQSVHCTPLDSFLNGHGALSRVVRTVEGLLIGFALGNVLVRQLPFPWALGYVFFGLLVFALVFFFLHGGGDVSPLHAMGISHADFLFFSIVGTLIFLLSLLYTTFFSALGIALCSVLFGSLFLRWH